MNATVLAERRRSPERASPDARRPDRDARASAAIAVESSHGTRLRRWARRFSLSTEDAEDAYQRSLEILLEKAPTDRLDELVRWLHTVVKHEALALRRRREHALAPDSHASEAEAQWDRGRSPDEHAEAREVVNRSREAIAHLKPQEIRCLMLKARGYSYDEISQRTGYTWTKVNRSISEGRSRFLKVFSAIEAGVECRRFLPRLSKLADRELAPGTDVELRVHLRSCGGCRATLREMVEVPRRVAELAPPAALGEVTQHVASRHGDAGIDALRSADGGIDGIGTLHAPPDSAADASLDGVTEAISAAPSPPLDSLDGGLTDAPTLLDSLRSAFHAVSRAVADPLMGRFGSNMAADAASSGLAAKVCTGAACVFIAGGAATAGIHRSVSERGDEAPRHVAALPESSAEDGAPASVARGANSAAPDRGDEGGGGGSEGVDATAHAGLGIEGGGIPVSKAETSGGRSNDTTVRDRSPADPVALEDTSSPSDADSNDEEGPRKGNPQHRSDEFGP